MAEQSLSGKVALVTGASRGIGAAIAKRFAHDGATMIVHYGKSEAEAKQVLQEIEKAGGKGTVLQGDTGNPADIQRVFTEVKKRFGKLDILVNNAAVMKRGMVEELTPEIIDWHLGVNVRGYLLCVQEAVKLMPSGGSIINVTSAISRMAYPGASIYTATKGAIDVMTRVLAAELGPRGIRVNGLAPGSTRTDMNSEKSGKTKEEEKQEIALTALRRIGEVDDIADAAAFLVSEDARWVTGTWLDVSGGIRL
jgi:3-oxoacyl-[acyl-carrier protein] reductase